MLRPIELREVQLKWTNFSGRPDSKNPQGGKCTFSVVLTEDQYHELGEMGWPVKTWVPQNAEDDVEPVYYLKVNINPNSLERDGKEVFRCIHGKRPARLYAETLGKLDSDRIIDADLKIRAFEYEQDKYSPWLNTMNVYVEESRIQFRDGYGFDEEPEDAPDDEPQEMPFE